MKSLLLLVSLAGAAAAQDITLPPPGPIPKQVETRDFSTSYAEPLLASACKSYNELVSSKDDDLMTMLTSRETYVCFREAEDVFNVISMGTIPPKLLFKQIQKTNVYQASRASLIFYRRFKDGQADESLLFSGHWKRVGEDGDPFFDSDIKEPSNISVGNSEIALGEDFKNIGGGTTTYILKIRRSTKRVSETFQWDNPPKDAKSQPDRGNSTNEGHCITFTDSNNL